MKLPWRVSLRLGLTAWFALFMGTAVLIAVQLAVRTFRQGLEDSLRARLSSALAAAGQSTDRISSLHLVSAEMIAGRPNLQAAMKRGDAAETLRLLVPLKSALTRPGMRMSLLAAVDGSGKVIASTDPGSPMQLNNLWQVKQALTGKSSVGIMDRPNAPPYVAAGVPLRDGDDSIIGAVAIVDPLDDNYFSGLSQTVGSDVGLISHGAADGRLGAAAPGVQRQPEGRCPAQPREPRRLPHRHAGQ